jgi:steroid delta-isomerase-like uncharacterized protein
MRQRPSDKSRECASGELLTRKEAEMAKNSELIRQWFEEVWNLGREATIDDLCAKQAIGHGQTHDGSDIVGPGHFKQFWRAFRSAFTSVHVEIHRTIEEDDMVIAQWTLTAQHTGQFLGLTPTGKQITATGMSLMHFEDGKIVEAWDNWDQLAVMVQLGAVSLENIAPAANATETRVA